MVCEGIWHVFLHMNTIQRHNQIVHVSSEWGDDIWHFFSSVWLYEGELFIKPCWASKYQGPMIYVSPGAKLLKEDIENAPQYKGEKEATSSQPSKPSTSDASKPSTSQPDTSGSSKGSEPQPTDGAEPASSSSSKPSTSQPDTSCSSKGSEQKPTEGKGNKKDQDDITQMFASEAVQDKTAVVYPTLRELFLSCDIVLPSITLKKFKMVESAKDLDAPSYVGVLAQDQCRMYKTTKSRLCS